MKKQIVVSFMAVASMAMQASVPEISNVTMAQQSGGRLVTVTYTLSDSPAVVTLDVQTNANTSAAADDSGWTSIGGEAVWNAAGDVWKKVETGNRTITWRPDLSWPDHKIAQGGARAVVTAWALDNTPDYMVVDLGVAKTVRYYPAVDFLPGAEIGQKGAVTNNAIYKTSKLLMRKIMARGVEWTMGSAAGETKRDKVREEPHVVTLDSNYYIGVFEITQAQWANIATNSSAIPNLTVSGAMRPMERVSYNEIRNSVNATANATYNWPADPNPSSFLGLLRTKSGLDFDLPSEAQWEFAARSGHGSGFWNNGSDVMNTDTKDENLDRLGRYRGDNPGGSSTDATLGPDQGGTAIVGSYAASSWGLYDMHGNVYEACLDWYEDNISDNGGKVNIDPLAPGKTLSGATSSTRVQRGGSWSTYAGNCRSAFRTSATPNNRLVNNGFRVVCRAGLQ